MERRQESAEKSKEDVTHFLRLCFVVESIEENILLCSLLYYNDIKTAERRGGV